MSASGATTLVLVTDTHLTPRTAAFSNNWRAARRWIESQQADLIVHLGDITADGESDPSEMDAAALEFSALRIPMRFLPGNHDIGDRPSAAALSQYRRCFGADRWTLDVAGWRLVGLNAQLLGMDAKIEEEQFAWLEARLAGSAAPVVLLLHKPLPVPFAGNSPSLRARDVAEPSGRYVPAIPAERLRRLCATCDLRLIICGHTHQALTLPDGSSQHVWLPSTSFCFPDALQDRVGDKRVGVMRLQLENARYRMEWFTPPGMLTHNILDFPQVYPQLRGMKEQLGPAAEL